MVAPTVAEGTIVAGGFDAGLSTSSVRIDRLEGAATTWKVGDVVDAYLYNPLGPRILLGIRPPSDAGPSWIGQIGTDLQMSDASLTCVTQGHTLHPVPKDVAYQAMVTNDAAACQETLATYDTLWEASQCSLDNSPSASGCSVPREAPSSGGSLTTAGVLAAILGYRRRRRAAAATRAQ
jgi:MYXO-CTERM domain-containing protein